MSYDYQAIVATIELLAETYPQCFSVWQGRRKPLKLGIHHDILTALDGAVTAKELSAALHLYCANWYYLKVSTEGAARIDLNGNVVGTVSTKEAADAKQRLEQQWARRQRQLEAMAKAKAEAEHKARNAGRMSLANLRKAAQARRAAA